MASSDEYRCAVMLRLWVMESSCIYTYTKNHEVSFWNSLDIWPFLSNLPSFYYLHNLKSYKVNTVLTLTFNRIPTSHGSSIRIRVRREDFQFEAGNYSLQPSITNHLYVYRHIWWTDWEEISRLSATHEESFTFEIFLKIFRLLLPLGASNAASQKQFILEKIFFM